MKILVVDIDPTSRWVLRRGLKEHSVMECATLGEARVLLENESFDVVMVSRYLPDGDGFSLLEEFPEHSFVVITSHPAIDRVVDAVKRGALGYVRKPYDLSKVREFLEQIRDRIRKREVTRAGIVLFSVVLRSAVEKLEQAVGEGVPVLVVGERGVGKFTVVSHVLNKKGLSHRVISKPGVRVSDISEAFAMGADYVVVRSLETMEYSQQQVLYRGLTEREVDPRVVFILHDDPVRLLARDLLFSELFGVISRKVVEIQPLRERREEIPLFVEFFRKQWESESGKRAPAFDKEAVDAFVSYFWPGNVRELKERLFGVLDKHAKEEVITTDHLPVELLTGRYQLTFIDRLRGDVRRLLGVEPQLHDLLVSVVERVVLEEALAATGGNKIRAAELVGLHRNTIRNKIKKLFGGKTWI